MGFTVKAETIAGNWFWQGMLDITMRGPKRSIGYSQIHLTVQSYPRQCSLDGEEEFFLERRNKRRSRCKIEDKLYLYREQEESCNGCRRHLPIIRMEPDHFIPLVYGGPDTLSNLQLLCRECNRIKGDRLHEYLVARLAEIGT